MENGNWRWQGLSRAGGVCAYIISILLLAEFLVYLLVPRATTALEHFTIFQDNWFIGLLSLDLLGMISYLLFVPVILALYFHLHQLNEAMMITAVAFFFLGIIDFFATNNAFSVLTLSAQYSQAGTAADKELFLAAGQAMLTMFNENAFLTSYVIVSLSWAMIAFVMIRSSRFSKAGAFCGLLAGISGIVAVVLEHVLPARILLISIVFYFLAIALLVPWVFLTGKSLYQAERHGDKAATSIDRNTKEVLGSGN